MIGWRRIDGVGAFALCVAASAALSVPACLAETPPKLQAGDEVFAVLPNLVLDIYYRSATVFLTAHRWTVAQPWTITIQKPAGTTFERCTFAQLPEPLRALTTFRAARVLTTQEAATLMRSKPLGSWAELLVRDSSAVGTFRLLILPPTPGAKETFARLLDFPDVFTLDRALQLDAFSAASGCK